MSVLKFAKIPKSAIKSNFNISHQILILPKCLSYDIYICFIALYSYCMSAIAPIFLFVLSRFVAETSETKLKCE